MKKILISIILFSAVAMPLFAETTDASKESRDRYYISSRLIDNTFVSVSGGVQGLYSPNVAKSLETSSLRGFNMAPGPKIGISFGKWMSAIWGGRIGLEYGNGGAMMPANLSFVRVASPLYGYVQQGNKLLEKSGYINAHMDLLCNWQNAISIDPDRVYSFIPYLTVGWTLNMATEGDKIQRVAPMSMMDSFTGGVGAINNFKVADRMNVFLDLKFLLMHPKNFSDRLAFRSIMPSAEIGFSYDIGHVGWVPVSDDGFVPNDRFYNGKSHGFIADCHFIDHTFVMLNAGVNHAFGKYAGNSLGYGIEAGRWFSPFFGGRIGYWAGDAGNTLKQKYFHMDLLLDILGMSGVKSKRVYTVAPYLHCGIAFKGGVDNSNPVKVGGGILQTFRIYKGLDAIIDASYVANNRWERVGTIQAGLAYNFGERDWEVVEAKKDPEADVNEDKKWAVYTNLVGYVDGTLNVGVQYAVGRHWTLDGQVNFNPHLYGLGESINEKTMVSLGARLWPWFVYSGFWCRFSAFAQEYHSYKAYDLFKNENVDRAFCVAETPSIAERGDAYGVGVSLGYSWIITKFFNLEVGLGGIGGYKNYVQYQDASFSKPVDHNYRGKGFACLNDLSVSAVFVF